MTISNSEMIARMLCYGVRPDKEFDLGVLRAHGLDRGFIQGAVLMLNGRRPVNTSILDAMSNNESAIPWRFKDGFFVEIEGQQLACPPLSQPSAINDQIDGVGRLGDYLRLHSPNTIFGTPIRECIFGAIGKGCKFCTFQMSHPKPVSPTAFSEMFRRIRSSISGPVSLALGAGTPNLRDHGARYFAKLVKSIHQFEAVPVSVEMVPPNTISDLDLLFDCGVGSLIMSLEIWNDARRSEICEGKAYVSREKYFEAYDYAVMRLGRGKVSSVLLVGLDDEDSTKSAIDNLTRIGVVPTLIPFRPYDDTPMAGFPITDHQLYLRLSRYNMHSLQEAAIGAKQQVGCTNCGGCSLEIEESAVFA